MFCFLFYFLCSFVCLFFFWLYFIWLTWSRIHFLCADRYQIATGVYEYKKKKKEAKSCIDFKWALLTALTHVIKRSTTPISTVSTLLRRNEYENRWPTVVWCWDFSYSIINRFQFIFVSCYQIYIQIWSSQFESYNSYHETVFFLYNANRIEQLFRFFNAMSVDHFVALETRKSIWNEIFGPFHRNFVYFNTLNNTWFKQFEKGARFLLF